MPTVILREFLVTDNKVIPSSLQRMNSNSNNLLINILEFLFFINKKN